jgi:hypothetical protein
MEELTQADDNDDLTLLLNVSPIAATSAATTIPTAPIDGSVTMAYLDLYNSGIFHGFEQEEVLPLIFQLAAQALEAEAAPREHNQANIQGTTTTTPGFENYLANQAPADNVPTSPSADNSANHSETRSFGQGSF